jgi:regulator of sigma E protease
MSGWYLLAAIPVFGLLVFVHELGHFATAKWSGIRVEEFGFGFPPRLFGIKRGETIYSLNWIPLGGFVRMPGENGELTNEQGEIDPGSFASKPAWRRALVLVAGVTMNVLLALLLFGIAFAAGESGYSPTIQYVCNGSPAALAGIAPGDRIARVNGQETVLVGDVIQDVQNILSGASSGTKAVPVQVVIERKGAQQTLRVDARTGDLSNTPCTDAQGMVYSDPTGGKITGQGAMGIVFDANAPVVTRHYPASQIPGLAVKQVGVVLSWFADLIRSLVSGALHVQLAGPVGITRITGEVASTVPTLGWFPLLNLTALLSLNLAIINILPFPALDGGRLALLVLEVVRRGKRLNPRYEGYIHLVGMAVLLLLVVVISWNDIGMWISQR